MVSVKLELNTKEVKKAWAKYPEALEAALLRGMTRGGEAIQKEAMLNLTRHKSVAFGMLRASMGVKVDEGRVMVAIGPGLKTKATAGKNSPGNYGWFVEHGRGPGKRPPPQVLNLWVKRKLGIGDEKQISQAAFLIGRKIGLKGTEPSPFLEPAVKSQANKVMQLVQRELDKTIQNLNDKGRRG